MSSSEQNKSRSYRSWHRRLAEMVLFAFFADLMLVSKLLMEALPNMHLLGLLIAVTTIAFRTKALIPIYLYVFLDGLIHGFGIWWIPYLYIWAILWGAIMLLPRRMPPRIAPIVYATVCGLHGILFGILYAPAQAMLFDLGVQEMLVWIVAGLPFDLIHGAFNFAAALFAPMLARVILRIMSRVGT